MPLECAQFLGRYDLAAQSEFQDLTNIGLDQGIDFLFGHAFTTQRFDCAVMSLLEVLEFGKSATMPFYETGQFGTLRRQTRRSDNVGGDRSVEINHAPSRVLAPIPRRQAAV